MANQGKRDFVHEAMNRVTAITAQCQLLRSQGDLDPEQEKRVEAILEMAFRLAELVREHSSAA
jgi:hypothetical protein